MESFSLGAFMVYKKRIKENALLRSGLLFSFNFSAYNMYNEPIISLENGLIKLYSHKLNILEAFENASSYFYTFLANRISD